MLRFTVFCLAGCGRIGFSPHVDAATVGSDSLVVASGPFGPASVIAALSHPAADDDPAISWDGLELYFSTKRATTDADIWFSSRATLADAWSAPTLVAATATTAEERSPALSRDKLTLWFDRAGDIFTSTRSSIGSPWSVSAPVTELDIAESTGTPATCDDERRMFARVRTPTSDFEIAVSTRPDRTAPWTPLAVINELNSPLEDGGPHPSGDCSRLYFHSNRTGPVLLYVAERDEALYRPPSEVVLQPATNGSDPSLTLDESYMVFSLSIAGNEEIMETSR